MMPDLEEVPRLRKALGLTQTALARLSNVSQSTIVKIEKKQMNPSYDVVRRVMTSLQAELKRQEKKALVDQIQTRKVQYVEAKIPLAPAVPQVDAKAPVELAASLLRHYNAVLVTAKGEVTGIVTKSDLMKLL